MSRHAVLRTGSAPSQGDPAATLTTRLVAPGRTDDSQFSDIKAQADTGLESASPKTETPAENKPTKWKMVVLTFVITYALTAIIIPRETAWLPHSWSFYQTNVITNVLLALVMTYLLPTITRLLRRWLS